MISVDTILLQFIFKLLNMLMLLLDDSLIFNNSWLSAITYNAVSDFAQHLSFFLSSTINSYSFDRSVTLA